MELRRRIGLLVPSSDTAIEVDLYRRLPEQFPLHTARMHLEATTVVGEEKMLEEELVPAARRLAAIRPELVIFGCTSATALHGVEGDAAVARHVESVVGSPCMTVIQAVMERIQSLSPKSVLLVTPYIEELNRRLRDTFLEAGLPVSGVVGMGLDSDLEIGGVTPEEIRRFVVRVTRKATPLPDCVFVSCTTLRAFEVAERLERELAIPLVTSNQCVFRAVLRSLQATQSPHEGQGQLEVAA